jgi:hypothetical protein
MYIDHIEIENFRTFRKTRIEFCHADKVYGDDLPRPRLPNVNLLLANNGYGKTTLLRAIALAALGPAVGKSGIFPYRLIRRENGSSKKLPTASLKAEFTTHEQDHAPFNVIDHPVHRHVAKSSRRRLPRMDEYHPDETRPETNEHGNPDRYRRTWSRRRPDPSHGFLRPHIHPGAWQEAHAQGTHTPCPDR